MKKIVLILAVLVTFFSAGYYWFKAYQAENNVANNSFSQAGWKIRIVDQATYNNGVIIESRVYATDVTLAWPGFVAVYENLNDKYGTLVGTSDFLTAGRHMYVPVDLVKSYKPGQKLYGVLHTDTGDKIFNLVQDPPVKDKNGLEVVDSFTVRADGFGHSK